MTPDAVTVITDGATELGDTLLSVGGAVPPIAAGVLALTVGWRFARKFIRG